jgi:hypothetical protein
MRIRCSTQVERRTCGQEAVIVILSDYGGVCFPVCEEHAAAEVHEAAGSMGSDEYRVINLDVAAHGGSL